MSYVTDFGAVGDGVADDSDAFEHAVADGDGCVRLSRGRYRITRTIEVPLDSQGPLSIVGDGRTCEIVMEGAGPALRFVGTHGGTAAPDSQTEIVQRVERAPVISQIAITGGHAEADGIELVGTMQANVSQVLLHRLRHGIRLFERNRNVLIENCQIYFNTGVGVYLDQVNLHQINIIGNHISYNRLGGVRLEGSEVRNLQITGNDIEYNNHKAFGTEPVPTAEIYIDTTAPGASVKEVAVCSNTIQATSSPGGANIRIVDSGDWTAAGPVDDYRQHHRQPGDEPALDRLLRRGRQRQFDLFMHQPQRAARRMPADRTDGQLLGAARHELLLRLEDRRLQRLHDHRMRDPR